MEQAITGYHKDDHEDWVAELQCGHCQHLRHDPPWQVRPWVTSGKGRKEHIGHKLDCKKCDRGELRDIEI